MVNLKKKRLLYVLLLLFRTEFLLWFGHVTFFTYTIKLFSKETIIKITFKMLHGRHWYGMFKRRKDPGYTGHNASQDHVHHKMWFIRHHICLVLQPMDTDRSNQRMLPFMMRNECISEAHSVGDKLEGWNSPKLRHLNNITLQKKQKQTKKNLSLLFPVLSKFRECFNSFLILLI